MTLTLQPHYQLQQWQSDCGSFDPQQNTLELLVQKDCTITARLTLDTPLYLDTNGLTIRSRPQGERFIGQTKLLAHPDPLAIRIVDQTARRTLIQQQDWSALETINTTFVTNLRNLFRSQDTFNQDIGQWDVRKVTTMRQMFQGATAFQQDLSQWTVSQVTDCHQFTQQSAFTPDGWPRFTACDLQEIEETKDCHGIPTPIDQPCPSRPQPQTKECNGQQIPVDEDCTARPATKTCWDGSVIPRSQNCPMQTKECNGQQIPVDEDCTARPATKTCWDGSVIPRSQNCPMQTKDCHGNQIPAGDTCPTLLKKATNGVTVIINPVLQNPAQYVGRKATLDGTQYTIVNNVSLKAWAAADHTNAVCTTLVTDMTNLFSNKTNFNQDIGDWDVSNVTDMTGMFTDARAFNRDIGDWDTGSVTSMVGMFQLTRAFNEDISAWDVSEVTDMSNMFFRASDFDKDLTGWDVSSVTSCTSFSTHSGLSQSNHPPFSNCKP